MTKARDLADFVSAGNPLADGTIDVADINGVTATTTEINYLDGVTSNIQSQFDALITDLVSDTTPQLGGDLDTNGNDITFGDNDKAIFGAGSDLQIFHDGTNSFISDTGTGDLFIQASNNHYLRFISGGYAMTTTENGQVDLRYDNATKLATTATGIDVTGKIQVTGGGYSLFDNLIQIRDDTNDTRISFERSDTGASGWIGIPNWDADALKIYGPTASGNEVAAEYTNGAWRLYGGGSVRLATTATGVTVTGTALATTDTDTSNTGSVTLDFAANQNFVLTLTGNVTLANPTTEQVGQSGFIVFIQDGTGGRTVSLGTDYETAGGAGLTLSSAASTTDVVPYIVAASGRILLGTPQLAFA